MKQKIEIVEYSSEWPKRFAQLGRFLRSAFTDAAVRIDHVGSTAVPGLAAKAIIDIQISVEDLDSPGSYQIPLEKLGYVLRTENPDRTKRYFREPPGTPRTHIHVRRAGSWAEQFALLFRDHLRTHSEDAQRYEFHKREMAERYRDDRDAYTESKSPCIWEIMEKANRWSQEIGWTPGPSDA